MRKFALFLLSVCLLAGCTATPPKHTLRVMSYNIRIGIGMDDTIKLDRIADVINQVKPDYVGLQEVDSVCERSDYVDQVLELSRLTGMYPVFAPATERSKGLYGIAALVKEEPLACRNIPIPGLEEQRTFLVLEYDDYLLCNTHFSLRQKSRMQGVDIIKNTLAEYDKPAVITGDFNMRNTSEECLKMAENWKILSDTTLKTFPSDNPRVTLDYIWGYIGHEYEVSNYKVIDEPMASDHRPIYLDVTM